MHTNYLLDKDLLNWGHQIDHIKIAKLSSETR
jgi:hypothetical protein